MKRGLLAAAALLLVAAPASAQVVSSLQGSSIVDSTTVTLDGSGNATWTFDAGMFPAAPDVTHIPMAMDTFNPLICNITTLTASAVSIHCWRTALIGLLTGLLSGPVNGGQVKLIARYRA